MQPRCYQVGSWAADAEPLDVAHAQLAEPVAPGGIFDAFRHHDGEPPGNLTYQTLKCRLLIGVHQTVDDAAVELDAVYGAVRRKAGIDVGVRDVIEQNDAATLTDELKAAPQRGGVEEAIHADVSIVKAWKGDTHGNLVYRYTARNFNPMMATAGRITIAEVEQLVEPGELDPDLVHTPGVFVQRILQGPHYEKRIEKRTITPKREV